MDSSVKRFHFEFFQIEAQLPLIDLFKKQVCIDSEFSEIVVSAVLGVEVEKVEECFFHAGYFEDFISIRNEIVTKEELLINGLITKMCQGGSETIRSTRGGRRYLINSLWNNSIIG